MKYIKTYEKNNYKIDDYVLIRNMSKRDLISRGFPADDLDINYTNQELILQIIETPSMWKDGIKKDFGMKTMDYLDRMSKPYTGKLDDEPKYIIRLHKSDIIKKLTPEEIEQYKIKKDTDKYNI